jgi:hypothetical protein
MRRGHADQDPGGALPEERREAGGRRGLSGKVDAHAHALGRNGAAFGERHGQPAVADVVRASQNVSTGKVEHQSL